ncbi:MORN repeat protein [Ichthyophthirius multifiliis]|uniref:MORN repeat protein n=1 Tax=Ichthyophthirius multifiliis TaxID=5932 RepID=G0R6A0_ICHMU|nr:MORN repeat protein [Ichthyophthirius multifiliis]EGR27008.1 MORN repeat protein [Ichthyophthirius multifiliis]|eukprot:XP_004023892.1 MORN repeat protein [Ichthyophthirius multifiliis]
MSNKNQGIINLLTCQKHNKQVRYICCFENCTYGNLMCELCINNDPKHTVNHKYYIQEYQQFILTQNRIQMKLLPSINDIFTELDNKFNSYQFHCEQETNEIDQDFSQLFKIFFQLSESAKTFLKENIKSEYKKIQPKVSEIKQKYNDLLNNKKKEKNSNIFSKIFNSNNDEKDLDTPNNEDQVLKIIKSNAPLNNIKVEAIQVIQQLQRMYENKVYYKKNQQSKQLFEQIKENFDQSCKEMYRKFKQFIEGIDEEENQMKKSIFTKNSQVHTKQKPQIVSIDLSKEQPILQQNQSQAMKLQLKQSMVLTKITAENKQLKTLKKIEQFPSLKNQNVLEAIRLNGSLNFRMEDSYYNNIPEQGPFEYEDGSIYYGHIKEQQRHGRGKIIFPDGAYYEGYWKEDIPFGMGRIIRNNGDLYQGQCLNYKAHGKGVFKTLKGDFIYDGEWFEDQRHGKGEEQCTGKYIYKGDFQMGKIHGQGNIKFENGVIYSGDFNNGEMTGQGEIIESNGEKYLGEVLNGVKQGRGIYIWPDGSKYEGSYENNIPHGQGIYSWYYFFFYQYFFIIFQIKRPDGHIYSGNWNYGLQDGEGIEINPFNQEKEGIWQNGKWIRWK